MAARTKSKVTQKYKTKYRVRNWAVYEESLRRRGDITVWFDGGCGSGCDVDAQRAGDLAVTSEPRTVPAANHGPGHRGPVVCHNGPAIR